MQIEIQALDGNKHQRGDFDCDVTALNDYLKQRASQDVRNKLARCYVATGDSKVIAGYYTLSACHITLESLPASVKAKLSYSQIPAARIGRLAVDINFRGKGLGKTLVEDALEKIRAGSVAAALVLVDAKDENAAKFYEHLKFIRLPDSPPITLILKL